MTAQEFIPTHPAPPVVPEEMRRTFHNFLNSLCRHYGFGISQHRYLRLCLEAPTAPIVGTVRGTQAKVRLLIGTEWIVCVYCMESRALLHVFAPGERRTAKHESRGGQQSVLVSESGNRRKSRSPKIYIRRPKHRSRA